MKLSIDMRKSRGHAWMFGTLAATTFISAVAYAATVAVDVGNGMKVMTDPSEPLKIAMFMPALNTSYLQANIKGAQDEAAKLGATISLFDAKFDPMNQLNQMQNAISNQAVQRVHRVPAGVSSRLQGGYRGCTEGGDTGQLVPLLRVQYHVRGG